MTTQTPTVQNLATEARRYFTTKHRATFWVLADNRPDWLQDLVRFAHADMLPDDWRYAFIVEALDALADSEDPDDITTDADRLGWLSSRLDRCEFVDQARGERIGCDEPLIELIGWGLAHERRAVLDLVRSFLEHHVAEAA